ncbi:hypothetical protein C8P69_11248 [Phreatobacter oligotrophus]|uniref:Uncharacterized protein n=1 Tax=Phreatobacter oligotrophus TaxID=1122261 RepID=A0A2T4YXH4_9HYPH|nr:hypothetical protein C8P69_11248 [Phreatobacter oligotrophus]
MIRIALRSGGMPGVSGRSPTGVAGCGARTSACAPAGDDRRVPFRGNAPARRFAESARRRGGGGSRPLTLPSPRRRGEGTTTSRPAHRRHARPSPLAVRLDRVGASTRQREERFGVGVSVTARALPADGSEHARRCRPLSPPAGRGKGEGHLSKREAAGSQGKTDNPTIPVAVNPSISRRTNRVRIRRTAAFRLCPRPNLAGSGHPEQCADAPSPAAPPAG